MTLRFPRTAITATAATAAAAVAAACLLAPSWAAAQQRVDGAIQAHTVFGQAVAPDEIKVFHGSEFKGAHKVAISAFEVAFPAENHFSANTRGRSVLGGLSSSAHASMTTRMSGVDRATQQRITDAAYDLFVAQLKAAGYEVVDQAELARRAPEFATWPSQPNFTEGRFGAYVAPTGQQLRFLQGDGAKRDTSGMFGQQAAAFRVLDKPVAFGRSPYVANAADMGVIAVTLVVDYGVYSSTGESHRLGGAARTRFDMGVSIAAGDVLDHGSLVEYWGPHSGGFPALELLQQPVRSELAFGQADDNGGGANSDVTVHADADRFEAAARDALSVAVPKLVSMMAAAR